MKCPATIHFEMCMSTQTMDLSVISRSGRQTPSAHTNTHAHTRAHARTHARNHTHARAYTHRHTRFLLIFHSFFLFFSISHTKTRTSTQQSRQKYTKRVDKFVRDCFSSHIHARTPPVSSSHQLLLCSSFACTRRRRHGCKTAAAN